MKCVKMTLPRRLLIAGSFAGDVNERKREFWLNSAEAKKYFDTLHILNASESEYIQVDDFEEVYFPVWLCHSKADFCRCIWGVWVLLVLFFSSPRILFDVLILEFKTMSFTKGWHPSSARKLLVLSLKGVCGLGLVFRQLHEFSLSDRDTVVVWSEHLTGMRLLKWEALRSGARLVFSEYGELPGTTFICDRGMFHESWPMRYQEQFCALPVSSDEIEEVQKQIQNIVNGKISSKVGQYATDVTLRALNLPKGKPVIYVNGVQSHASGLFPRCSDFSKEYSPYFGSNEEILEYFAKLAEKHDWTILYKDHPNTCNYFSGQEIRASALGEHVKVLGNIDIYEILSLSDMTVSLGSKTVFLSLLNQVPVFLMGPYSLGSNDLGCGVYSGGVSEETIVSAIQSARCYGVDVDSLAVYLTRMMKYYYYSMDDDANSLFGRGRQQFWKDFLDYLSGGRCVISAKVNLKA